MPSAECRMRNLIRAFLRRLLRRDCCPTTDKGKIPFEGARLGGRLRRVNTWDIIPILLLVLFFLALSTGTAMVMLIIRRTRQRSSKGFSEKPPLLAAEWTHPLR